MPRRYKLQPDNPVTRMSLAVVQLQSKDPKVVADSRITLELLNTDGKLGILPLRSLVAESTAARDIRQGRAAFQPGAHQCAGLVRRPDAPPVHSACRGRGRTFRASSRTRSRKHCSTRFTLGSWPAGSISLVLPPMRLTWLQETAAPGFQPGIDPAGAGRFLRRPREMEGRWRPTSRENIGLGRIISGSQCWLSRSGTRRASKAQPWPGTGRYAWRQMPRRR